MQEAVEPCHPVECSVFGKHPAWADHMETQGARTGALSDFQQSFYMKGIGECISKGKWGDVIQTGEAIPYDHRLLSVGPAGAVAATFVASSDSKGRQLYPLVVAMASKHGRLLTSTETVFSWMDGLHTTLATAQSEIAVSEAFTELKGEIASLVVGIAGDKHLFLNNIVPNWSNDAEPLARVLHCLSAHAGGYGTARVALGSSALAVFWLSFIRFILEEESVQMSLVWRKGASWADVFLFPPDARSLGGLFITPEKKPLTSGVPFQLSDELIEVCRTNIPKWLEEKEFLTPANVPMGTTDLHAEGWLQRTFSSVFRRNKAN